MSKIVYETLEEIKQLLIGVHNNLNAIKLILIKVNKIEICPHVKLDKTPIYTSTSTHEGNTTTRKCLDCGALVTIPEDKK